MTIEVRLFANLARYLPPGVRGDAVTLELPEGAPMAAVLTGLGIPDDVPRLLFVNGRDATPADRLRPGDVVTILPPLVGGGPATWERAG